MNITMYFCYRMSLGQSLPILPIRMVTLAGIDYVLNVHVHAFATVPVCMFFMYFIKKCLK